MNDEVEPKPERDPAAIVGDVVTRVIRGWPVYGAILGIMWLFAKFYLVDMIGDQIQTDVAVLPAQVALTGAVQTNTNAVVRIEGKVEEVERDTKQILFFLANGRFPPPPPGN